MSAMFDPKKTVPRPPGQVTYHYDDDLVIAISAARAARRPLLLRGNPGTGKSTLAADLAWCLDWRFEREVVTSRTQAQDLLWRFDAVRRLADLQGGRRGVDERRYLEPGVLWHAFDPVDAGRHGVKRRGAVDPRPAVVLVDEIDKADPDVPNDLLVVIDEQHFQVTETGHRVEKPKHRDLFLILTTNRERELPGAFMRRCVVFDLPDPGEDTLKTIARYHHGAGAAVEALLGPLWSALAGLAERARPGNLRAPTTAEYLDALQACVKLGIEGTADPRWKRVVEATMWKHAPASKS